MSTIITTKIFEDYLNCETKAYLRAIGKAGKGNSFADWIRLQNALFGSLGMKKLAEGIPPHECLNNPPDAERLKRAKWRLAANFVARTKDLQSSIQALIRTAKTGRTRFVDFIPIRFVFKNHLARNDKLLLTFDGIVISQLLGRPVRLGKLAVPIFLLDHLVSVNVHRITLTSGIQVRELKLALKVL